MGAGCVTLSWYGPAYDGGSVVTGYAVQTRRIGGVEWSTLVDRWVEGLGLPSVNHIAQLHTEYKRFLTLLAPCLMF